MFIARDWIRFIFFPIVKKRIMIIVFFFQEEDIWKERNLEEKLRSKDTLIGNFKQNYQETIFQHPR